MTRVVDGHTDLRIKVTGHTDNVGSDAYNIDLSKRRAQSLIDFFVAHGLSKDRIEIDFKGESDPIDNNSTPEGKQHNRRVDFVFI
jgi:outer membrane protein OmpA-like peptidoglycan-associated protein